MNNISFRGGYFPFSAPTGENTVKKIAEKSATEIKEIAEHFGECTLIPQPVKELTKELNSKLPQAAYDSIKYL
ncbi:MAG: hypothetical protein MJ231_02750 [bacterium]|nr:hypothetical protein [bacterium]